MVTLSYTLYIEFLLVKSQYFSIIIYIYIYICIINILIYLFSYFVLFHNNTYLMIFIIRKQIIHEFSLEIA